MNRQFDYLLKLVLIGDQNVGKSSILLRYADNTFAEQSMSTIGVDFKIKTLTLGGKTVKLQVWDTAGQEKFRNITTSYYRGAHGIIIVFDVTSAASFKTVDSWLAEIARYVPETEVRKILIGNKTDLVNQRQVSSEEVKRYADAVGLPYIEASAKDDTNIDNIFTSMARDIVSSFVPGPEHNDSSNKVKLDDSSNVEVEESGGCCG